MTTKVPFIDLTRFEPEFLSAWQERVVQLSSAAQYIGGPWLNAVEDALTAATDAKFVVTCANGTDALQLALRAAGITPGDIVLIPDLTFWATFEAVINVGASPYVVDCDAHDLAIDVDRVGRLINTVRPAAVIVVHLYGWGSEALSILRHLCRAAGIPLIEDAAQAFGVRYEGKPVFAEAQIATTSFYPAKVLGAAGDGGAVFCQDAGMAERIRCLSNHGRTGHYQHEAVGWNSRLDSLQAAYLELSLLHINARLASRRKIAKRYRDHLLAWEPDLVAVGPPDAYEENGYCNVCLVGHSALKQAIEARLQLTGIEFARIYPAPISAQPGAKALCAGHSGGRVASRVCESVLNLPLFAYMTESEVDLVTATVGRAIEQHRQTRSNGSG